MYEQGAPAAQNLDALTGKILRVTRSGQGLPTNPFWTGDADDNRSKVWAYGLRNPFRLSVRPGSHCHMSGTSAGTTARRSTWRTVVSTSAGRATKAATALSTTATLLSALGLYGQPRSTGAAFRSWSAHSRRRRSDNRWRLPRTQSSTSTGITESRGCGRSASTPVIALVSGPTACLASGTRSPVQIRIGPRG